MRVQLGKHPITKQHIEYIYININLIVIHMRGYNTYISIYYNTIQIHSTTQLCSHIKIHLFIQHISKSFWANLTTQDKLSVSFQTMLFAR